jgi:membrane protease YdiL (CAAX protease family)
LVYVVCIAVYLAAIVWGAAALAPPLWWLGQWAISVDLLPQLRPFPFDKYYNRAVLLIAVGALPWLLRRLQLRSWAALGLAPNPRWRQDLACGFAASTLGFAAIAAGLFSGGALAPRSGGTPVAWLQAAGVAAVVAGLEEVLFRGVLLGALRRTLPQNWALAFVSMLFAAVHFLRPNPQMPRPAEVTAWSGFALVPHLFWEYGQPARLWGALTTLTAMAAVLGYTVLRTRALHWAIGLHAGWVFAVKMLAIVGRRTPCADLWLGDDLRSGMAPLALMLGTALGVWALLRRRPPEPWPPLRQAALDSEAQPQAAPTGHAP